MDRKEKELKGREGRISHVRIKGSRKHSTEDDRTPLQARNTTRGTKLIVLVQNPSHGVRRLGVGHRALARRLALASTAVSTVAVATTAVIAARCVRIGGDRRVGDLWRRAIAFGCGDRDGAAFLALVHLHPLVLRGLRGGTRRRGRARGLGRATLGLLAGVHSKEERAGHEGHEHERRRFRHARIADRLDSEE